MDHTVDASQKLKQVKSISPGKKSTKSKASIGGKPKLVKTAKNSDYDNDSVERQKQVNSAMNQRSPDKAVKGMPATGGLNQSMKSKMSMVPSTADPTSPGRLSSKTMDAR